LWALSAAAAAAVVVLVVAARSHLPVPAAFKVAASSSSAARAFDAKRVPLVTERVRASLADFDRQPDFKAVAISHIGWGVSSGAPDAVSAEREAIDRCKKRDQKGEGRVYAVGALGGWPLLPLPSSPALHLEPLGFSPDTP